MAFPHFRRLAAITSVGLLAMALVGPTGAIAGNTRDIYVGSPPAASGSLVFSRTVPGGLTAVDVQVRNDGNQNINSVSLRGGAAADNSPVNPLFPPPTTGPSLPADATYVVSYPACDITLAGLSISCSIGTLSAGQTRTYRIIIRMPAAGASTAAAWFGVYLAEGNATGANQDNFYASGTITASAPQCDTNPNNNKAANYFLPTDTVSLATCSGLTRQTGSIAAGVPGGNGTYAEVSLDSVGGDCSAAGYTCYGDAIEAHVLGGQAVPGGLQWTVRWYGVRSLSGVIHFWDTYDADHASDFTVIPFSRKLQCSSTLTTNCWISKSSSKGNVSPPWFEAVFVTPTNGRGGGYF